MGAETISMRQFARCKPIGDGCARIRTSAYPQSSILSKAGSFPPSGLSVSSWLLRLDRHQLVALRAHAEARQARFLHELVAEGIAESRGRPDEEAAALRVLHHRWPDRTVKPGAEARFAPHFLPVLGLRLCQPLPRPLPL